ncbi:hypothetical protein ACQPZZ_16960 [Microbispora sp. CA-135349]|uniref:hypothetical protein n=1 Tax=Microbispora sp. CA-135349 TaxID=3239953 RepID=UPI003D8EBC78
MAPLLLATALFPDGRPALPIAVKFAVLGIVATSVTVATDNWPRSDGGAGYNPVLFPRCTVPPRSSPYVLAAATSGRSEKAARKAGPPALHRCRLS